ncbi:MAG: queuosine precursor transporter [Fimbriimonadales bacterium]|nr:queuosine precursor transporter [Fimbriimonadales bacterium]
MSSRANTTAPPGYSVWFVGIVALFLTSLLTANLIASKVVSIAGLVVPAGIIIFPISYIVGDVLTEVYGYRRARRVIWLGFGCNLLMVLAIQVAIALPPAPDWKLQEAYAQILGMTPRLLMASFVAYLFGEFSNAFVLAKMKILTQGRWLWTRTIGSTLVGQAFDSAIFCTLAFVGVVPPAVLLNMILTQWLAKSVYEALATPLTYLAVGFLKAREGIDVYDYETRFNPFVLEE